jgi:hypothetical protein
MFNRYKFKINTAIFIFLAFIFRLLFVNIGLLSSLSSPQTNKLLSSHFAASQKRRRAPEVASQSSPKDYTIVEVCEEGSDNEEEDFAKVNLPVILSAFYAFLTNLIFIPKSNPPFESVSNNLYSKRYLSLSILKI